ncbi:hypothetical protein [Saccharopolyspora taberi]|uniref:Amidohydrolase 3 domain-containing protein n=1 Tax=Saccharopolyspora taberi TaxID=60895 RepID=A0ABN3V2D3_9PSEU
MITLTGSGPREFANLLIGPDDRIAGLDVANAGGARRVDGRGRVLVHGLNDAHGHMLRVRTVKLYVDGALGSRGAALLDRDPLRDGPAWRTGVLQTWVAGRPVGEYGAL